MYSISNTHITAERRKPNGSLFCKIEFPLRNQQQNDAKRTICSKVIDCVVSDDVATISVAIEVFSMDSNNEDSRLDSDGAGTH
jgi:hypothetical protein